MTKYGIKTVQQGTSVEAAGDYQVTLSSEWPTLQIIKSGSLNLTDAPGNIFEHNLKYLPAFLICRTNAAGQSSQDPNPSDFYMDTNKLYYSPSPGSSYTGYYYVFSHNLSDTILPTTDGLAAASSGSGAYGLRVGKPDDRGEYPVHPSLHPLVVHMSGSFFMSPNLNAEVVESNGVQGSVRHSLGYRPLFFSYIHSLGDGSFSNDPNTDGPIQFTPARTFANNERIGWRGVQAVLQGNFYYIVLKDPILSS